MNNWDNMLELAGFATFALASSITPGPNNMMMTTLGASVGFRRGIPALLGIAFGFAVMIFLISLGIGRVIIDAGSTLTAAMRLGGLLIIAWMAWQIATAPVEPSEVEEDSPATGQRFGAFFGAAAFQWVNPKAWIICASAITAYLDQTQNILPQAVAFASTFVIASFAGCLPWLAAGTLVGRFLQGSRVRLFNVVMAALLVVSMIPVML